MNQLLTPTCCNKGNYQCEPVIEWEGFDQPAMSIVDSKEPTMWSTTKKLRENFIFNW